jgi:hypothetical protein
MWEFDTSGSLTLPREGKIYGIGQGAASDRAGYISWTGNSSGDGSGFNTMRLVPDLQGLEDADQYIIIDPTGGVPGHIHIRAGGTQDNSGADLFLGGENSHVKISAGLNPPVTVKANNNSWTFGANGVLILPTGTITSVSSGYGLRLVNYDYASQLVWQNGTTFISGNTDVSSVTVDALGVGISVTQDGYDTDKLWQFGNTGNLTFPGNLVIAGNTNVFGTNSFLIIISDICT